MKRSPPILDERPRKIEFSARLVLLCLFSMASPSVAQVIPGMALPTRDPVHSEIELNRGIVAFEQNRFGEALERLANAEPAEAGASYYRGLSLLALRRAEEALTQLEAVGRTP